MYFPVGEIGIFNKGIQVLSKEVELLSLFTGRIFFYDVCFSFEGCFYTMTCMRV